MNLLKGEIWKETKRDIKMRFSHKATKQLHINLFRGERIAIRIPVLCTVVDSIEIHLIIIQLVH